MASRAAKTAITIAGAAAALLGLAPARRRLQLSRAKHRSLTGHVRMAKRIASLIPFYAYDEKSFFRADDPPEEVAVARERRASSASPRSMPSASRRRWR